MTENPYQPPVLDQLDEKEASLRRRDAVRSFRMAIAILLVPALYNYSEFDAVVIASGQLPGNLAMVYRAVNVAAFVIGALLLWFVGVRLLEIVSQWIRNIFARSTEASEWLGVLYRYLAWVPYLAIPGAVLWMAWVFAFYQRDADFDTISWLIGVPANLLAACFYVPLLFGWYRLSKTPHDIF
ncbi:MAG: hypothetical protein ACR2NZ_22160 [Rubripirellula sp.]